MTNLLRIRDEDKNRLIRVFEREDYVELAIQLNVNVRTASSSIRRHQLPPSANAWGGFRGRKVDEEMTKMAIQIVEEHLAMTLG